MPVLMPYSNVAFPWLQGSGEKPNGLSQQAMGTGTGLASPERSRNQTRQKNTPRSMGESQHHRYGDTH